MDQDVGGGKDSRRSSFSHVGDHQGGGDSMSRSFNDSRAKGNTLSLLGNRDNRALSMPVIASGQLPDISERSREEAVRAVGIDAFQPRRSIILPSYPRSVPSSPEKRYSIQTESEFEISFERPRSEMKTSYSIICPFLDQGSTSHFLDSTPTVNQPTPMDSSLDVSKGQASRRESLVPDEANNSFQRTIEESQQSSQQTAATTGTHRQSILPSVSIDEATEPEDNESNGKTGEETGQCLPNDDDRGPSQGDDGKSKPTEDSHHQQSSKNDSVDLGKGEEGDQDTGKDDGSTSTESKCGDGDDNQQQSSVQPEDDKIQLKPKARTPGMRRRPMIPVRKRASRSISPISRQPQYHMIRIQPAIPPNANIRHIMENVVKTEGPFENPEEALRAALAALGEEAWTTKVEGMLAVTRLASFHPSVLQKDFHSVIVALVDEVKNLRSSVSRSAIFTLGDLFVKMKRPIETEIELIGSALINKCSENASFIREDCERALMSMIDEMPQIKSTLVLVNSGANHRNMNVRRTSAHFLSILVERMGPVKCLMGPKDIGEHLLQSAAKFLMDGSPHTRYYGRKMFSILMNHNQFDKLLRKHVTPGTYRNICGILESIKRRGIGEKPADLTTPVKV